jgi:uncharacterized protein
MSRLADQLALLGRQAGAATRPPQMPATLAPATATIAHSELETLRRLLGTRQRSTLLPRVPVDSVLPGIEIAPGLRYVEHYLDQAPVPEEMNTGFAGFESIARAQLMHFDTETTGLSGGTGTRAFMIGVADWCGERLRVRQLYLATMAAEPAMLRAFAEWLTPEQILVSYNGRCYDAPLLATRYRLARLPNPLQGLRHLDLLFPVRRRYRGVWENCRLATIERNLLGVLRDDDLPGSEAPRAWRDYLTRGDARDLRRVLAHNDQDVVTLAQLLQRML